MIACTFVPSIDAQDGHWQFVYALNILFLMCGLNFMDFRAQLFKASLA